MRKNIRRTVVLAAAASGIWALGAATASADELPVAPDAGSVTDSLKGADADSATGTVTDTVDGLKGEVQDTTDSVTQKLPTKRVPETGLEDLSTTTAPDAGSVT
ncbi:hypothetical protein KDA82_36890, partial [Streptomyces daliensis]|nr:hypothetical protein [Streptomyces daliensis]